MAFTRAPVNDTHNTVRLKAQGENFLTSDASLDVVPQTMNYINCFPLSEKQWNGEERKTIHRRDAWDIAPAASGTVTTSGVLGRMLVIAPDQDTYPNAFFAKHSVYYMFNYSTKAVTTVTTSAVTASAQYASADIAVDNSNVKRICFLDGSDELKTWLQDGTSVTTTVTGRSLDGRKGLVFLNGYLFAVNNTGYYIYNSAVGGNLTTWNSTDFIAAEQYADPILWIDRHKNYLVSFGVNSIEFFYDGGVEVGSPLVRQENYSRRIGIYTKSAYAGKITARIDDDLYFLGCRDNDSVGLYRIRNFQVEEIKCQYMANTVNLTAADPKVELTGGIETVIINNNPMILVNVKDANYSLVYFPDEDTWWQIRQGVPASGLDFFEPQYRWGTFFFSQNRGFPMWLSQSAVNGTGSDILYYNIPDYNRSRSLDCYIYTPVVDMGINFYKHAARIDAIGDFGSNNTITLGYNFSPNYEQSYTDCGYTRTPGTEGYSNNASWYNLGAFRRATFRVKIAGYDHWVYEGLDIEYNAGAA